MKIKKDVLDAFNLTGNIECLSGGRNTSIRVNDAVLKPIDNIPYYEWLLNIISKINPQEYRLSKPIKSNNGTFIHKGWCCNRYEPGEHKIGNIKQKLEVSRLFHNDLAKETFENIPRADDPWSKSQLIAWQRVKLPQNISKQIIIIIEDLLCKVRLKENYKVQIVHSDLSGNIMFDEILSPLIIDFSPTIAPVEYAEAILVCDCIAWQGSSISEIELICHTEFNIEMILRAIIFRLSVTAIFAGDEFSKFIHDYLAFKPIIDYINRQL